MAVPNDREGFGTGELFYFYEVNQYDLGSDGLLFYYMAEKVYAFLDNRDKDKLRILNLGVSWVILKNLVKPETKEEGWV